MYQKIGRNDLAKKFLIMSLTIAPQYNTYTTLADVYAKEGRQDMAWNLWKKALNTNDAYLKVSTYKSMIAQSEHNKDYPTSNALLKTLMQLKDSIAQNKETSKLSEIQKKYDNEILSKEKYRQALILTSVIIVLMLAGLILLYQFKKRERKYNRIIESNYAKIHAYERQISEIESKKDTTLSEQKLIKETETKIKSIYSSMSKRISRGRTVYESVKENHSIVKFTKDDITCFIDYYKMLHYDVVRSLERDYENLSPRYIFYNLIYDMEKNDEEFMTITGIGENAVRSFKSRTKSARKSSD